MKQNKVRGTLDEFRKTFLPGHNVDEEEGGDEGKEGLHTVGERDIIRTIIL